MPARPKRTSLPTFDDVLAMVFQIAPDRIEDFKKLSEALSCVLADGSLAPETEEIVLTAKKHVDLHVLGELPDGEAALVEVCRLLENASKSRERPFLQKDQTAVSGADKPAGFAVSQGLLPHDADADLAIEFVLESRELLDRAESALLALENNPDDAEAVNTVFRAFHTIKGTSGFLGMKWTSEIAHLAESLLARVRNREIRLTGGYADLALQSVDFLKKAVGSLDGAAKGARMGIPEGFRELKSLLSDPEAAGVSGIGYESNAQGMKEGMAQGLQPDLPQNRPSNGDYDSSIRVNTARLDRLIDLVGELVIAQSMIAQDPLLQDENLQELPRKVAHTGKIVRELQDLSMSMRMVPLRNTFQKMQRLARDLVRKNGKSAELVIDDAGTEIDRHMVAVLNDVLVHMIRNAIDHGIEPPDERERKGKPRTGMVRLGASCSGGTVVVEVHDDGRGLNRDKILGEAVSAGIVSAEKLLNDDEVFNLIFAPGLSTTEQVTDVSGRGVGMDVVRKGVESLHGRIEISTARGVGSTFTVRLPLTLAITDAMLVRVGPERYLIPTISIHLCFRPQANHISTVAGRGELVMLRGELMPLFRLHRLFDIRSAEENPAEGLLVVVGGGDNHGRCAILVDELLGQQQVVAKSLTRAIGKIPGISGGAILGDGRVGLILDAGELCQLAVTSPGQTPTDRTGS